MTAERAAYAVRGHWLVENALLRTLDVIFKDDQSGLRKGHGYGPPFRKLRWTRLVRQLGGLAKVDRVCFYAANCSVISAVA